MTLHKAAAITQALDLAMPNTGKALHALLLV